MLCASGSLLVRDKSNELLITETEKSEACVKLLHPHDELTELFKTLSVIQVQTVDVWGEPYVVKTFQSGILIQLVI